MSLFTAAIFDMDGLLLDSERLIMRAWLEAAAESGQTLCAQQFLDVIGHGVNESRARLMALLGGEPAFERVRAAAQARQRAYDARYPVKPGAQALLLALRSRGIACAVASSTAASEVSRRLERAELLDYFSAFAGGDEVPTPKPAPDVYLLASARLGVPPAQCLAFEDSEVGAQAAHAARMRVVLVPDLRACAFDAALLQLKSLEQALAHCEHWF